MASLFSRLPALGGAANPTAAATPKSSEPEPRSAVSPDAALMEGSVLCDAIAPPSAALPKSTEPISFEAAVERYHGKVFQLVYRYTGDYEESCDLTQDTFLRAYGAWNEFRGDSQLYTWLYRIAINLCHNQQRKHQRRRRFEPISLDAGHAGDDFEPGQPLEVADSQPLPLQMLERGELRVRLHQALRELPDNYRTVIVLRDIEGLTYDEIAHVTESSLEAIKSRLFRARNALRELLNPYLNEPLAAQPAAVNLSLKGNKLRR
jgi:RNA polymerase sigma-70 factor (ECF subfamily)